MPGPPGPAALGHTSFFVRAHCLAPRTCKQLRQSWICCPLMQVGLRCTGAVECLVHGPRRAIDRNHSRDARQRVPTAQAVRVLEAMEVSLDAMRRHLGEIERDLAGTPSLPSFQPGKTRQKALLSHRRDVEIVA